jgi:hypothetical protein
MKGEDRKGKNYKGKLLRNHFVLRTATGFKGVSYSRLSSEIIKIQLF